MKTTTQIQCPECESTDFKVQQYTWNEQAMSVRANGALDWGLSDNHDYESEKPLAVVCDNCEEDCSALFKDQIDMYEDRFHVREFPVLAMLPENTCAVTGCNPACPHVLADFVDSESK